MELASARWLCVGTLLMESHGAPKLAAPRPTRSHLLPGPELLPRVRQPNLLQRLRLSDRRFPAELLPPLDARLPTAPIPAMPAIARSEDPANIAPARTLRPAVGKHSPARAAHL